MSVPARGPWPARALGPQEHALDDIAAPTLCAPVFGPRHFPRASESREGKLKVMIGDQWRV